MHDLTRASPVPSSLAIGETELAGQSPRMAKLAALLAQIRRRGLSALGPVSVSAAHFFVSLVLLHFLPTAEFGEYSFIIVVSALGLGFMNALLGAPISSMATAGKGYESLPTYFKTSAALSVCVAAAAAATMFLSKTPADAAGTLGVYAGLMSFRSFSRTYTYANRGVARVVSSDLTYSATLVTALLGLLLLHRLEIFTVALAMAVAAFAALFPFGFAFFRAVFAGILTGSVRAYRRIWQEMTRWSLLGVISTEITINAHAYLVTFIAGSKSFAILAVGSLFLRPFSLTATALPDQERPIMSRSIAAGDIRHALKVSREFVLVIAGIWLANVALAAAILYERPDFVTRKGFAMEDVVAVVALWAVITAVRGLRAGDAVLLQASRQFKPLADAGVKSSVVALVGTLALLLIGGPVFSLGGILLGDIAMWVVIRRGVAEWKASALAREAGA